MKRLLFLFVFNLTQLTIFSQNTNWAKAIGSNQSDDRIGGVDVDSQGNIYISGRFSGNSDFDPGPNTFNVISNGFHDAFLLKLDPLGNFLWVKTFGSIYNESSNGLEINQNDEVIIYGAFYGTVDFDPGIGQVLMTAGSNQNDPPNTFILKFDTDGNLIWARNFGSLGVFEKTLDISISLTNDIYLVGQYWNTVDFDPGIGVSNMTSVFEEDPFILKLNDSGNFVWAKSYDGFSEDDGFEGVLVDHNSNIFVTGWFNDSIDINPDLTTQWILSEGENSLTLKIDSAGNTIWGNCAYGGANNGMKVAIDSSENIYAIGKYIDQNVEVFDGVDTLTSSFHGSWDFYIHKMNVNGQSKWLHGFGSDSGNFSIYELGDIAMDIEIVNSNIIVTGAFSGYLDFDPDSMNTHILNADANQLLHHDTYLLNLDTSGHFNWVNAYYSDHSSFGEVIVPIDSSGLLIAGDFNKFLDANPSPLISEILPGNFSNNNASIHLINIYNCTGIFSTSNIDSIDVPNFSACSGDSVSIIIHGNLNDSDSWLLLDSDTNAVVIQKSESDTIWITPIDSMTLYLSSTGVCGEPQLLVGPINIAVNSVNTSILNITNCSSYTVPSGDETYFSSGTYTDTLIGSNGCDSLITVNLNITNSYSNISSIACYSYTVPSGDETYFFSGVYQDTIPNSSGCDSIITVDVVISPHQVTTISETACNHFTVPSGDETYFTSGNYEDTLTNIYGCDSLLEITLDILTQSESYIDTTICADNFDLPSGNYSVSTSGFYQDTITNTAGCDSIININLVLHSIDTAVDIIEDTLMANFIANSYQWIECKDSTVLSGATDQFYLPIQNGNYAVVLYYEGCVDTSECIAFQGLGENEINQYQVKVFPNPTFGNFVVELVDFQKINRIEVLNTLGTLILREDNINNTNYFELQLSSGIYFIDVVTNSSKNLRLKLLVL
ncbi:T9SS type A sorting domain-containing protein [Paracrocinitomix mangrovi]|uniref:T9SS type A sorting domain-containing protein n=1 Tax=Paracrocinitomix mangrovi TaxID=2862509 RepID=UPI001C8D77CE|nr:T9SS type A sorting domain-containing protein [Paracrocinitomix mangrovi]UKN00704.1 T9SS type A sorting domain-containing protein [Paracrocinitomix mangrovi]